MRLAFRSVQTPGQAAQLGHATIRYFGHVCESALSDTILITGAKPHERHIIPVNRRSPAVRLLEGLAGATARGAGSIHSAALLEPRCRPLAPAKFQS